jgi:hypothetical protein
MFETSLDSDMKNKQKFFIDPEIKPTVWLGYPIKFTLDLKWKVIRVRGIKRALRIFPLRLCFRYHI